jgi:hypothetical protein
MGGEIQALKSEIRGLRAKLADDENRYKGLNVVVRARAKCRHTLF